jgi:hypothetical protein
MHSMWLIAPWNLFQSKGSSAILYKMKRAPSLKRNYAVFGLFFFKKKKKKLNDFDYNHLRARKKMECFIFVQ